MKNRIARIFLLFFLITAFVLALPVPVFAQGPSGNDSPVIFGSDYVLASDQSIKDLVVFGGNATLDAGSMVTGDVVIFGGNLVVAGEVRGDITTFGGDITVSDKAVVGGDLNTLGGSSQISAGAVIRGKRLTGVGALPLRIPTQIYTPAFWVDFGPGASLLSAIFGALILGLMAALVALFLPVPTDRVAQTIGTQPVVSGAIGLLTLVVTPALFLVLAITVILIPLGLIGLLVFGIALLFGWTAIGQVLGKSIAQLFKVHWAVPVSAGVGTLLLSLVTNMTLVLTSEWFWTLCCLGIPLVGLVLIVGLGGVVTSKFGATVYNPNQVRPAGPLPPAYPQGPVPPAYPQAPLPPAAGYSPQPPAPPAPPTEWARPTAPQPPVEPPQPPAGFPPAAGPTDSPLPPPSDTPDPNS
jgi:hypothetical protein